LILLLHPLTIASHESQSTAAGLVTSTPASPKSKVLSEEKIEEIVSTVDFGKWLDASSRIVERMLGSNNAFDVMIEYDGEEEQGDDVTEKTKLTHTFVSQRWTEHRTVTSISWSLHHKELMLVSYSKNNDSNETRGGTGSGDEVYDGVVAVWSLNMLSRPEYVFTCQSQVLTACFNRFDAQKVVGATYSGQIVVWDMRSKSSPVYRTSLTAAAHTHPVFSLCIVGTIHAHSIVSAGNDGRLSLWNPSNLNEPTTTLDLVYTNPKSEGKKEDVSVTCMDFAYNETNQLIVGTESGDLFAVSIHGSKTGVVSKYSSHYGPITGLHFHPTRASGMGSLGHLLLTSSVDFTVKLWNSRINAEPLYTFTTGTYGEKCGVIRKNIETTLPI
jgi:dynein intermediate chain